MGQDRERKPHRRRSQRAILFGVIVAAAFALWLAGRSWFADPWKTAQYPPPVSELVEVVRQPYTDPLAAYQASLRIEAVVDSLGPDTDVAVRALLDVLERDGKATAQGLAIMALGDIGSRSAPAVPKLTALVVDKAVDAAVRKAAADALAAIGPTAQSAVPALAAALAEQHKQLRVSAAQALSAIGPGSADAVPDLVAALGDEEWQVRTSAARALGAIGPDAGESVPALIVLLQSTEADEGQGIPELEKSIPMLNDVLTSEEREVVEKVLESVKSEGVISLVRMSAARALAKIGPRARSAVPALSATLRDPDVGLRIVAAESLGALGSTASDAVTPLTAALDDEDDRVRQAARAALEQIQGAEAAQ